MPRAPRFVSSHALGLWLAAVALAGCGASPGKESPDAAGNVADAAHALPDGNVADAAHALPDAAVSDSAAADAPSPLAPCAVPAPRLGNDSDALALAAAPARCGQTGFHWLSDPSLGTITAVGSRTHFAATTLNTLVSASGTQLPLTLTHDVDVAVAEYTTQDRGVLLPATAVMAWPTDLATRQEAPILLVLHGTTGFTDACAPSATPDTRLLAAAFASAGYVAVAPDYLGMLSFNGPSGYPHPYLVGQATAIASLDSVRAAVRIVASENITTCADTRFVAIGGSQGGHAALWVDRLAPYYAPELTLAGVVATVPPADILAEAVRALTMTVPATLNTVAFYAASAPWYDVGARLSEVLLPPYDTTIPMELMSTCSPGDELRSMGPATIFTSALRTAATSEASLEAFSPWGCIAQENSLTSTSVVRQTPTDPSYGVLWVLGAADQLVSTPIERQSFVSLCAAGMRMQYLECAGAGHTQVTGWALPEILEFARARLGGQPMDPTMVCDVTPAARCLGTPAGM